MESKAIEYFVGSQKFQGFLTLPRGMKEGDRLPGILIAPAWWGLEDFAKEKTKALAALGYVALAVDMYGDGINAKNPEEAESLMKPLFLDRRVLQERIIAGYKTLKLLPYVDNHRLGAIGFCFGGLTVIELLRSGADVKGVVSFHGVLGNSLGGDKANMVPMTKKIHGAALVLHGNDDPFVTKEDINDLQNEFTKAGIDWQMHIYGHIQHAFTNPKAHEKEQGLMYNAKASRRSWESMRLFFLELFA